jgi:hypothetical protein
MNPKNTFKLNPIEGLLFGLMALIFCHSMYSLVYDFGNLRAAPLGSTSHEVAQAQVTHGMSWETRAPASKGTGLRSIDFKCEDSAGSESGVSATKVRLTGPLCGLPSPTAKLVKTQIVNGANKYSATVFTDVSAQKFSTDYIPLVTGRNSIHVEFEYQGGKTFSRDLALERN